MNLTINFSDLFPILLVDLFGRLEFSFVEGRGRGSAGGEWGFDCRAKPLLDRPIWIPLQLYQLPNNNKQTIIRKSFRINLQKKAAGISNQEKVLILFYVLSSWE